MTRKQWRVASVALRKESVDRNTSVFDAITKDKPSLSARRAWIEIPAGEDCASPSNVALRKESVDRNDELMKRSTAFLVALRKESVDRNYGGYADESADARRSPQGERG